MSNGKKTLAQEFSVLFNLPWYVFLIFAAVVVGAGYMGVLPQGMAGCFAFMIVLGTVLGKIGDNTPIIKDYLGGGAIVIIFGSAALNYFGLLPSIVDAEGTVKYSLVSNITSFFKPTGAFLDFYIAALITGSILGMNRKLLVKAAARYFPAIFGGLGLGLSLGLVMRGGASTGGMDIPPLVLKKFFRIPVSVSLWAFDFVIMLTQMTFHKPEDLLYGIILLMTISFSLNKVLLMGTSRTEVKIVSAQADAIRDAILSKVDRGVTMLHGEGGFLHAPTEMILSVVSNHELPKIERLAREIDPACFVIINRVSEVWGRGFSHSKQYQFSEKE